MTVPSITLGIVALIADNCEINRALADICNVPVVGFHSHRLSLAVKEFLKEEGYEDLIHKVNS